ncbi:MAG: purine-binding chemotaxis protein CheW [Clostridiales bacterium]|jgi:purine-binding chemotaxis protein CheW|nr:purine-binding chemotaxis protein CheW [Clostridiales bacterium]
MDNLDIGLNQISGSIDEMRGRYLTFFIDNQVFGIPIADVIQIVGVQEITEVPEFPTYAKGIINLRGNIVPLIDMRIRFHKEELPYNDRTCVIVTNIGSRLIGLVVEAVDEVASISDEEISPPPVVSSDDTDSYITGIGLKDNKIIVLLDTQKILSTAAIEKLSLEDLENAL